MVTLHLAVSALLRLLPLGQVVAVGGQRTAFLLAAQEEATLGHLRATARELATLDTGTSAEDTRHERTVAATGMGIATHIEEIAARMGRVPGADDDVDAAAVAALRAGPPRTTRAATWTRTRGRWTSPNGRAPAGRSCPGRPRSSW